MKIVRTIVLLAFSIPLFGDTMLPRHEGVCLNKLIGADLTDKWYDINALGQPYCPPKPASSWESNTFHGSWCSSTFLQETVVKDIPVGTQGCTIHQMWGGVAYIHMQPDCNGYISSQNGGFYEIEQWQD